MIRYIDLKNISLDDLHIRIRLKHFAQGWEHIAVQFHGHHAFCRLG